MPGRSTLTATSRPSVVTAKCTWAIEAAATGASSKLVKIASIGWPSSASMMRRASAPENAGRWSCKRARSAATSSLNRSARVDSAWPSLMKDGPISCSAAASRSPGRRESRRRANSRAQAISAGAMPSDLQRKQRVVPREAQRHAQQAPVRLRRARGYTSQDAPALSAAPRRPASCRARTTLAKPDLAHAPARARAAAGSGGCFRADSGRSRRPWRRCCRRTAARGSE